MEGVEANKFDTLLCRVGINYWTNDTLGGFRLQRFHCSMSNCHITWAKELRAASQCWKTCEEY